MKTPNVVAAANVRTHAKLAAEGYHPCSIVGCDISWKRGGVLTPEPLCPRHYHRRRRGSTLADSAASLEARDRVTYRPTSAAGEAVRAKQKELARQRRPSSVSDAINALLGL